jgi:hypothetical protein
MKKISNKMPLKRIVGRGRGRKRKKGRRGEAEREGEGQGGGRGGEKGEGEGQFMGPIFPWMMAAWMGRRWTRGRKGKHYWGVRKRRER